MLVALALALAVQPNLSKLVLKPAQVGPTFVMQQMPNGHGTAERTLDLCGTRNYPSEKLRTKRLQVNYKEPTATYAVSNEVVTYKAGGAAQAMREVAAHVANCPRKAFVVDGQLTSFRMVKISDSRLLKGYIAVQVRETVTLSGKKVTATYYAVYQRFGNVISGVYSYGAPTPDQELLCLHAAEASARNLRASQRGIPA